MSIKFVASKTFIPAVLVLSGLIFILHYLGIRFMDEYRIMEILMSPGLHGGLLELLAASGFMAVRFLVIIIAPAALMALAVNIIFGIFSVKE